VCVCAVLFSISLDFALFFINIVHILSHFRTVIIISLVWSLFNNILVPAIVLSFCFCSALHSCSAYCHWPTYCV